MKPALLIIALWTFPGVGHSQGWYGVASVTYFTNSMTQLRELQEQYNLFGGIPLKVLSAFPPYWGWAAEGGRTFGKDFSVGLGISYTSTGGRVYYEDYSGSVSMDQVLSAYSLTPFFQVKINRSTDWPLFFSLGVSWVMTNMHVKQSITVNPGPSSGSEADFHSNNFGMKPSLVTRKQLGRVFAQATLGYEFQTTGKLYLDGGTDDQYIRSANGDPVTAQWSGLRVSLGIGMLLGKPGSETMKQQ